PSSPDALTATTAPAAATAPRPPTMTPVLRPPPPDDAAAPPAPARRPRRAGCDPARAADPDRDRARAHRHFQQDRRDGHHAGHHALRAATGPGDHVRRVLLRPARGCGPVR